MFPFSPSLRAKRVSYTIESEGNVELYGHLKFRNEKRVNNLGSIIFSPDYAEKPAAYTLKLAVEGTDICNSYEFWIYPEIDVRITYDGITTVNGTVRFTHSREEAADAAKKGIRTICVPDSSGKLPGTYCTDFWCYPMFRSISESMNKPVPIGTMGLLIDNKKPVLRYFPSETFSTPQWYNIVMHSHCEELDGTDIIPDVWVIDNPDRAERLGLLYEDSEGSGSFIVCTSRLWEIPEAPEVDPGT